MYQRYYKQRKFGRIFSFALVVGSGVTHYVKSSYQTLKNTFKLENVMKYEEYFPDNVKSVFQDIKEIQSGKTNISQVKSKYNPFEHKKIDVEKEFMMKNKWIFSDTGILHNEEKINKYDKKDFKLQKTLDINEDDVKLRETFLLFNKLKNKFI
jgi:hypothetical protein